MDTSIPGAFYFPAHTKAVQPMITVIPWIAVFLLLATSTGLLFSRNWQLSLGLLAIQYLGTFWLVGFHWPIGMAAVKLVTGWMASATLGITQFGLPSQEDITEKSWPEGHLFRAFAAGIVVTIVVAATPRVRDMLPGIGLPEVAGTLLLVGMGLLHLGITTKTLRVIIGLLTVLAGFEILYTAMENSNLVAALLAGVNLGLALVGSYLLNTQETKQSR